MARWNGDSHNFSGGVIVWRLNGALCPCNRCSLRCEHQLQRFVQPRSIFLGHRDEFNAHAPSRRDPSHNSTRSHLPELQVHQYLHHAAEWHSLARKNEQSSQPNTLQIRDGPASARLPRNLQTLRRHGARIAPLLFVPHGGSLKARPERPSLRQKQWRVKHLLSGNERLSDRLVCWQAPWATTFCACRPGRNLPAWFAETRSCHPANLANLLLQRHSE